MFPHLKTLKRITVLLCAASMTTLVLLAEQVFTAAALIPWFQTLTVVFLKLLLDANQLETDSLGIRHNEIH